MDRLIRRRRSAPNDSFAFVRLARCQQSRRPAAIVILP